MLRTPLFFALLLHAVAARAAPLSVDDAVTEALAANARLPIAQDQADLAAAAVDETRGQRGPSVGIEGDLHGGYPLTYASGDGRLQVVGDMPIFDPGQHPAVQGAQARAEGARHRLQAARDDVEEAVRDAFARVEAVQDQMRLQEQAAKALEDYMTLVEGRRRSGDPVAADALRAKTRLELARADLAATRRHLGAARITLNNLLGRDPNAPLELAPEPSPTPPADLGTPGGPDVAAAAAEASAARTGISAARAARLPRFDLVLDAGAEPVLGPSFDAPLNTGRGYGVEGILSATWHLWDLGVTRAQVKQATLAAHQAAREQEAAERDAAREHALAASDLAGLADEATRLQALVPDARDAWILAESEYRGGSGTALEVLDAWEAWTRAGLRSAQATLDYRRALAHLRRWEER